MIYALESELVKKIFMYKATGFSVIINIFIKKSWCHANFGLFYQAET